MKAVIRVSKAFKRQAKPLLKKYASLPDELKQLNKELSENPYFGVEIMPNVHKIRMAIKSKGKGKSGGVRIITFHQKETIIIGFTGELPDNKDGTCCQSNCDLRQIESGKYP
jgi:mRNA-degrading endonuclease RelE of RelBE toxin-antitoxin system